MTNATPNLTLLQTLTALICTCVGATGVATVGGQIKSMVNAEFASVESDTCCHLLRSSPTGYSQLANPNHVPHMDRLPA
jgi:hypothetical protein